mmetsp:Transcript_27774/g.82900  ORF Transcript_27774/g.82900 Transcript_27774/m.82900 type:complete len:302 (-) Transcript_27774:229-1134(-)
MGASICCEGKEATPGKHHEYANSEPKSTKDQEDVDSSGEVDETQFSESVTSLVKIAANGYPKALRSTNAKRNEFLRKHNGDADAAATEVKGKGHSLRTEVKDFLFGLIPYIGLPVSVLKPLWVELRRGCLIAAIYGHDLSKEETQARVLLMLGVAQGGEKMKEKSLELAIKFLWSVLCKKCGLSLARRIPVGKMASVLDFADKAKEALVNEFKPDASEVPESVYSEVLDEKPSTRDLLDLVKEGGVLSLVQARERAASLLTMSVKKDELLAKGGQQLKKAAGQATAVGTAVMTKVKEKAGF